MQLFLLISALLVVARAGVAPVPTLLTVVPVGQHSSQYHSQDSTGQYSYGYSSELSAKNEVKTADGETVGAYSYVDPEGKLQNVEYRADAINGFRVMKATNMPVAPVPIQVPSLSLPQPVKDTAEVIEARTRHLEAVQRAEEEAKRSSDTVTIESKATIGHPAIISPTVFRLSPAINPTFGYSFGINPQFYTINGHLWNAQPVFAYTAPHFIAAPVLPEAPKDLPDVVEARAKHMETVEMTKKEMGSEEMVKKE